ncbi:MAG: YtxH domain-containing protein [Candidatus Eisenbacteria bacterium]|nr:YtxH domain-containing protein [Candidatus Eisenbacteria bacterium]
MSEFSGYENRPSSRSADIMLALSIGLAVGAAGALLLAPASGQRTRRRIGEFAEAVSTKTSDVAHRATEALRGRADKVDQVIADGKQAYRQAKDTFTS